MPGGEPMQRRIGHSGSWNEDEARQSLGKHVANLVIRCLLVQLVESQQLDFENVEQGKETWGRKAETWITQPDLKLLCR